MSIASEITKLNTNLTASYTACQNKNATMPANQNFDNLATCIGSISTGYSNVKYSTLDYIHGNTFFERNVDNHYYLPNAIEIDGGNYPVANPTMYANIRMLSGCFPQLQTTSPFLGSTITNAYFPKLTDGGIQGTIQNCTFGLDGSLYTRSGSFYLGNLTLDGTLTNVDFPNLKCQYTDYDYDNYWDDFETETDIAYSDIYQTVPLTVGYSILTNVTFGSLEYFGRIVSLFDGCTFDNVSFPAMTDISGSNIHPDYNDGFNKCSITMRDVKFPNLKNIPDQGLRIDDTYNEEGATKLEFGDVQQVGNYAFPNDVKTLIFNTLDFENGTFATNAFANLSELTALVFKCNFVNSIGQTGIILNSEVIRGGALNLQQLLMYTPIASGTGYIYVPDELVNTYKTTDVSFGWGYYASQIKGLSELPAGIL